MHLRDFLGPVSCHHQTVTMGIYIRMKVEPPESESQVDSHSAAFLTIQFVWDVGGRNFLRNNGIECVCVITEAWEGRLAHPRISFRRNAVYRGGDCLN